MFDGLFEIVAQTLSFFYDLVPNYAIAIALLTLVVMVITTPLTLKGTRSMIQMQRLQPEMRRLQVKYKDDRQKLNEELMAFYKENNLNPLGGCLPLLLQTPIFILLYNVIRGLTTSGARRHLRPEVPRPRSQLYQDLHGSDDDDGLRDRPRRERQQGPERGLHPRPALRDPGGHRGASAPTTSRSRSQGRNPDAEIPPQQKMLMRVMPAMFVVIAFVSPAALVVYFVTSNLYRIGMQAYITRIALPRRGLARRPGPAGPTRRGEGARRRGRRSRRMPRPGGKRRRGPPKTSATEAPAADPTPDANGRADRRRAGAADVPHAPAPNRSKKKKKRR